MPLNGDNEPGTPAGSSADAGVDVEKAAGHQPSPAPAPELDAPQPDAGEAQDAKQGATTDDGVDIEHVYVDDDPRKWKPAKQWTQFFFVCYTAMAASMSANIFFPAIDSLQSDLKASQQVVNLSVSLFVFFQGVVPILWSGISEIYGRKIVYITAYILFTLAQLVCAVSKNQILFLIFRIVGAAGSSAGLTIGGGSLADLYDPHERGTRIGIYYLFPLLGPTIGTLLGGALTLSAPGWRAAFWFMTAYGASCILWAFFSHETFRKERSVAWNKAYKRAEAAAEAKDEQRKAALQANLNGTTHHNHHHRKLPWSRSGTRSPTAVDDASQIPLQGQEEAAKPVPFTGGRALKKVTTETGEEIPIKIHLSDINPLAAAKTVMSRPASGVAVLASGILFGAQYSLTFTGALSFAAAPYHLDSLKVGLVLLCFGVGNIVGSVCGGRLSDIILRNLKAKNGGRSIPEWRLRATFVAMPLIPASFVAYAWTVDKGVHVYGPCIVLFSAGMSSIWLYSATLAYLVDSSVGMASSAISCNSASRGIFGFLASEIGEPLLTSIGNGWLYTMWTFIQVFAISLILLVYWKGQTWRENAEARKEAREAKRASAAAHEHEKPSP